MPDTAAIAVRLATVGDVTVLVDYADHLDPKVIEALVDASQVFVVENAGTVVGWLRWNLFWDAVPFMNMLYILKPYRGQGVGSMLVARWQSHVHEQGYTVVMTSTQADEQAQHFYRKLGWVDCGALFLPGGPTEIMLRKELNE